MRFLQNKLDPLTRKRLRRFRRHRRAYVSFWLLVMLYGVSLVAEVFCNDRPLYLRFNGKSYFPFIRFYPESAFIADGEDTRPDYKALRKHPVFRDNPDHFMIFPPIPFGPEAIVDPETLRPEERVTLTLDPVPRVAAVNVTPDLKVQRALNAGWFFGVPDDDAVTGLSLTNRWTLPEPVVNGIRARFANNAAPPVTASIAPEQAPERTALLSLSPYRPRRQPPRSVRLTFREPGDILPAAVRVRFDRDLKPVGGAPPAWKEMPDSIRAGLLQEVHAAFEAPQSDRYRTLAGHVYRVHLEQNEVRWPHPPTARHWLGIDKAGRDVLARIVYGLRISMTFAFVLVAVSSAAGIFIGAIQGYCGGRVDIVGQRLIEIWSTLPFLYIMILMGSVYGRSFVLLLVVYGIFRWIGISYYMRAEFLRLRKQPFVEAARALGIPARKIMFRHILPNALTPVITFFPFSLVGAIASLTALDYLGFGLPPPTPSWGELLHQAQQFRWAWWLILYPSLAVFIVMLLGVFVGEGVRDAFDPRPNSRME